MKIAKDMVKLKKKGGKNRDLLGQILKCMIKPHWLKQCALAQEEQMDQWNRSLETDLAINKNVVYNRGSDFK